MDNLDREPASIEKIREKYTPEDDMYREEHADFLWVLHMPIQYHIEQKIVDYMNEHPNATLKDLVMFLDSFFPGGILEGYPDWDDE